jgi:hypothetical protein
MPPRDFKIFVIVCSFLAFILFGLIIWLVYYFLKRNKNANAAKISLGIFTGLVIAVTAVNSAEFSEKMRERRESLYLREFRESYIQSCIERGKAMKNSPQLAGLDSLDTKMEGYCWCAYDKMESNEEIRNKMLDQDMEPAELLRDSAVIKIATDCALENFTH